MPQASHAPHRSIFAEASPQHRATTPPAHLCVAFAAIAALLISRRAASFALAPPVSGFQPLTFPAPDTSTRPTNQRKQTTTRKAQTAAFVLVPLCFCTPASPAPLSRPLFALCATGQPRAAPGAISRKLRRNAERQRPRRTAGAAAPFAQFCGNPPLIDLAPRRHFQAFAPLTFPAPDTSPRQQTDGSKRQPEKYRPPISRLCLCAFALRPAPRRTGAFSRKLRRNTERQRPRHTTEAAAPFRNFAAIAALLISRRAASFALAPPVSGFRSACTPRAGHVPAPANRQKQTTTRKAQAATFAPTFCALCHRSAPRRTDAISRKLHRNTERQRPRRTAESAAPFTQFRGNRRALNSRRRFQAFAPLALLAPDTSPCPFFCAFAPLRRPEQDKALHENAAGLFAFLFRRKQKRAVEGVARPQRPNGAALFSVFLDGDNLLAGVGSTSLANSVSQRIFSALRALHHAGKVKLPDAGTSLVPSCFRRFMLRYCHFASHLLQSVNLRFRP